MAAAFFLRASILAAALTLPGCAERPQESSSSVAAADNAAPAPDTPVSSAATGIAAGTDAPKPSGPARPSDCNAPEAERFVGREATPPVRSELAAAVAPITAIRWVGPGDATTEDYSAQRLNVMLDVGGVIRSAHCG